MIAFSNSIASKYEMLVLWGLGPRTVTLRFLPP